MFYWLIKKHCYYCEQTRYTFTLYSLCIMNSIILLLHCSTPSITNSIQNHSVRYWLFKFCPNPTAILLYMYNLYNNDSNEYYVSGNRYMLYHHIHTLWSPTQPYQSSDGLIIFPLLRSADTNTKIFGMQLTIIFEIGIFSKRFAYIYHIILFKLENKIQLVHCLYTCVYWVRYSHESIRFYLYKM